MATPTVINLLEGPLTEEERENLRRNSDLSEDFVEVDASVEEGDGAAVEEEAGGVTSRNPFNDAEDAKREKMERLQNERRSKPTSTKSAVWDHVSGFTMYQGRLLQRFPNLVVCEACVNAKNFAVAEFSRGKTASTTPITSHIKVHHKEEADNIRREELAKKDLGPAKTGSKNGDFFGSRQSVFMSKLSRFIVDDYESLSKVEKKPFRALITALDPRVKIPDRKALLELLEREKISLEPILEEITAGQEEAVTVDGWTDVSNRTYYALTRHFIDADWELNCLSVSCILHDGQTKEENLEMLINELLEKANVKEPVALVSDCEPVMVATGRRFTARKIHHNGCIAHRLETVTKILIECDDVAPTMKRSRRLVGFFNGSSQAAAVLEKLSRMCMQTLQISPSCERANPGMNDNLLLCSFFPLFLFSQEGWRCGQTSSFLMW
jgi:hypothetical protein